VKYEKEITALKQENEKLRQKIKYLNIELNEWRK